MATPSSHAAGECRVLETPSLFDASSSLLLVKPSDDVMLALSHLFLTYFDSAPVVSEASVTFACLRPFQVKVFFFL
jgi:hypothetical protein